MEIIILSIQGQEKKTDFSSDSSHTALWFCHDPRSSTDRDKTDVQSQDTYGHSLPGSCAPSQRLSQQLWELSQFQIAALGEHCLTTSKASYEAPLFCCPLEQY